MGLLAMPSSTSLHAGCDMITAQFHAARCRPLRIALVALIAFSLAPLHAGEAEQATIFHQVVAPLLVKNCVECHNTNTRKGKLSIETLADVLKGGEDGAA